MFINTIFYLSKKKNLLPHIVINKFIENIFINELESFNPAFDEFDNTKTIVKSIDYNIVPGNIVYKNF